MRIHTEKVQIDTDGLGELCENLRRAYNSTTVLQRDSGKNWYRDARKIGQFLSGLSGQPLRIVVGVIAVTSPGTSWEQNILIATQILLNHSKVSCRYWDNVIKARKIIALGRVFPTLHGPKVTRFFFNIMYPDKNTCATIDRWALRTAVDDYTKNEVGKLYWTIEQAYMETAREFGLRGSEFQAILWVYAREQFPQ